MEWTDNFLKMVAECQLFMTLLLSMILRSSDEFLQKDALNQDQYGTLLVVIFFAAPSVAVVITVRNVVLFVKWKAKDKKQRESVRTEDTTRDDEGPLPAIENLEVNSDGIRPAETAPTGFQSVAPQDALETMQGQVRPLTLITKKNMQTQTPWSGSGVSTPNIHHSDREYTGREAAIDTYNSSNIDLNDSHGLIVSSTRASPSHKLKSLWETEPDLEPDSEPEPAETSEDIAMELQELP